MLFKKKLLSSTDEARLIEAIKSAESKTSGELRVHIEETCDGDALEACKKMFAVLNMHQTKDRNGILFFLAIKSKSFAVWGDEGIHKKVTEEFWEDITECAIGYFKRHDLISGLEKAVEMCGEKLHLYFPLEHDDKDELTNDISY
ncbi:MAG: TPM domain-containing protein [Burkholderiales bacterium]|nr:TPM domain-containing protein [Bacteroidia bacterium]